MSDYEFLSAENIPAYIRAHPALAEIVSPDDELTIDEIGDGNLNLVFRVRSARGSVILKQALPYVRMTGEGWPMTPERAAREAHSLHVHASLAGDVVVRVIEFDPERYVIAMEDLSDHRVWRDALNAGEVNDGVAAHLGRYVAQVAVGTSMLGAERTEVAAEIAATQNPDLCVITEDLVFTEPARDIGRNSVAAGNVPDAAALAADDVYVAAMAEAKWRFMTHAEALIHGDLHTGSVMVRGESGAVADSVKVFDSEFAFYGPIAFDLGALYANYSFAAARAYALGEPARAEWALGLVAQTATAFREEFLRTAETWTDTRIWDAAFAERRVSVIEREAWLFASAKMARRMVGAAKVRDIESLDEDRRVPAVRAVLAAARAVAAGWDAPHDEGAFGELVGSHLAQI